MDNEEKIKELEEKIKELEEKNAKLEAEFYTNYLCIFYILSCFSIIISS